MKNEKNDKILNYYIIQINYTMKKKDYKLKIKIIKDYVRLIIHYIDNVEQLNYYLHKIDDKDYLLQYVIFDLYEEIFRVC